MSEERYFSMIADETHSGIRVDKLLSLCCSEISRSMAAQLIKDGNVSVDGKVVRKSLTINAGNEIVAVIPEPEVVDVLSENIPIEIIYEDEDLLVVNKPQGMVVHPAVGNYSGTLVNALMYHCKDRLSTINGVIRPGIVHRIDKNTSGLLIVAKNDFAHTHLAEQIKVHSFTREYEAIVCGRFKEPFGTVNAPIGRHSTDRKKMTVTEKNSRSAVTHFKVINEFSQYTHLRLKLETGRTHQIRVHMAHIGHSVLGDDVYGKAYKGLVGQCLHAKKIGFIHPSTNEYIEFESELPQYFLDVLSKLR